MTGPMRLLHQITLRNGAWGGVEQSFCGFVEATCDDADIRHYLVENLRRLAPDVAQGLKALSAPAQEARRWHGLPVPKIRRLRRANRVHAGRGWDVNTVLNWNLFGDCEPARIARALDARAIYWERGAAWFGEAQPDPEFAGAYDLYLSNSQAARQMLMQRWNVRREIAVCSPPVFNPTFLGHPRQLPVGRPLRIGFAARLRAFKGGVLALHAVRLLRQQGFEVELWVAGDGADLGCMQAEAARIGLAGTRFLGRVMDMRAFYADIDLLLHPALREPFGNSCSEALTAGLPVVATRVDGLPEVVDDGVNGRCVTPTLPLGAYAEFGGNAADVYPLVYRPESGTVAAPGLPDPAELAAAVAGILGDPARYAEFSAAACASFARKFSPVAHVRRLKELLRGENPAAGVVIESGESPVSV